MGMKAICAAYELTAGDSANKALLVALADHACDECGLAWPGTKLLHAKTELRTKRIQAGLKSLIDAGWISVYRFPFGGRGLSTEYVVLPHLWDGAIRPCQRCRSAMKSPAPAARVLIEETTAPAARVSTETRALSALNPGDGCPTNPHRTNNPHARARARRDDSGLPAGSESPSDSTPQIPAESREALAQLGLLSTDKAP